MIRRNKYIIFFIGIIVVIIFYFCNLIIYSLIESSQEIKNLSLRSMSQNRYTLSDNYRGESEQNLMQDIYKIQSLKEFYLGLKNWEGGKYFIFSSPGLLMEVKDKSRVTLMRYGYEEGMMFDESDIDEKNLVSVKQISLNKVACDYFGLSVSSGQLFTENDYTFSKDHIPVLLGSEYANIFQSGDIIPVSFYGESMSIVVCGILNQGEYIVLNDEIISLDRYVITASQEFPLAPTTNEDLFLQAAISLDNINGQMQLYEGVGLRDLIMLLETYQHKYGIEMVDLLEVPNQTTKIMNALNDRNLPVFMTLTIVLIAYTIIAIDFTMKSIIDKNKQYYAINLLCGKGLNLLVLNIFLSLILLFIISHILAALLTCIITAHQIKYNIIWVIISSTILLTIFTIRVHIRKISIWEIVSTERN